MRTFWIAGIVSLTMGSLLWLWLASSDETDLPVGLQTATAVETSSDVVADPQTGQDPGGASLARHDAVDEREPATSRTPVVSTAPRIVGTMLFGGDGSMPTDVTWKAELTDAAQELVLATPAVRWSDKRRFAIEVDVELPAGTIFEIGEYGPHGQRASVEVALPAPLVRGGEVDVGCLALQRWVCIVRGRVIDDLGAPIGEALVIASAEAEDGESSDGTKFAFTTVMSTGAFHPIPARASANRATISPGGAIQLVGPSVRVPRRPPTEMVPGRVLHRTEKMHTIPLREQTWFASAANDGSFEIFAPTAPTRPISVQAIADGHQNGGDFPTPLGGYVEVVMARAARLEGSVILPEWMPATAVQFVLEGAGGDELSATSIWTMPSEVGQPIEVGFHFEPLDAGTYALLVRANHVPLPLAEIRDVRVAAGASEAPPHLQRVDLRHKIHRYELTASDERGARLTGLESPLLVRCPGSDGEVEVRGFPWLEGRVELFHPAPSLEVTLVGAGYRLQNVRVTAGPTDLRFVALHPVELDLPGLRGLCGPTRKVRISTVLRGSSGLPQSLNAVDQRSGESQGFQRWHLAQSGGAWLGDSDVVRVPLVHNGTYEVIVRLHRDGVQGDRSISCGVHGIVLDGIAPQHLVIPFSADAIRSAIAQLDASER